MTTRHFFFIDSRVTDYQALIDNLPADAEWIWLTAEEDGVLQMQRALAGYTELDSIQIVSHGSAGTLYLGSTVLDADHLSTYESSLQAIGSALAESGDLLLYGCQVGEGAVGRPFITALAGITRADVAASTDWTGAAAQGGDWQLETTVGAVETLSIAAMDWTGILATYPGTPGNDTLMGTAGDDIFMGGAGNDSLNGGAGQDVIVYENATAAVTVNLLTGNASGASIGTDTLVSIENVIGSGFNDTLIGNSSDNWLQGRAGNDTLDGGAGSDWADYRNASGAVTVNLSLASNQATGADGTDQLINIEYIRGSNYADTLIGDEGENILRGGAGNDTLNGGVGSYDEYDWADYRDASAPVTVNLSLASNQATGADGTDQLINIEYIIGSNYADTLTGNSGDNMLRGQAGNDTLNGGAGSDWADYRNASGPVTVNLSLASNQATGADGTDQLINIENIRGGDYADTLTGNSGDNWLRGRAGNDTLNGGAGSDWADYRNASGPVTVNLSLASNQATGADGTDQVINIENIRGGDYADTLTGNNWDNWLAGRAGNDTLDGGAGWDWADYWNASNASGPVTVNLALASNQATGADGTDQLINIENIRGTYYADTLTGNSGDNWLRGQAGNDTLDGGAGYDLADYGNASGPVTVNLTLPSNQATGADGTDQLINIEYIGGSNYADTLVGNDGETMLRGRAGNDTLDGRGGYDWIDYREASGPVTVNLSLASNQATGADGTDQLISIEDIIGSNHADTLTGNSGDNMLRGQAGNDTLNGGAGSDWADYRNASGPVTVNLSLASNQATGADGTDQLINIENIRGGDYADTLTGNSGDNWLRGRAGNDTLNGGAGSDWADYWNASGPVTVNLSLASNQATGADGTDQLINIENIRGGDYADTLTGNASANVIDGAAGNDTLDGGSGSDTMTGGDGSDVYYVRDSGDVATETNATASTGGTDTVYSYLTAYTLGANIENGRILHTGTANLTGNALNNVLYVGTGNNVLNGGAGTDTLSYAYGVTGTTGITVSLAVTTAQATGGSGSDTLTAIENLTGSAYADRLTGNASANVLDGSTGNDTMTGGDGSDVYYVRDSGDVVTETNATASTGGTDTVYSYLTAYTLGANVENGRILSTSTANLTGNTLNNVLTGNASANVLDGGAGSDTMTGGDGSDVYYVRDSGDVVTETNATASTGGTDTVYSYLTAYTLGANVENGRILHTGAANLTGNALNNVLYAGTGNNVLNGGTGTDTVSYAYGVTGTTGVTVNLAVTTAQATGGSGSDTLTAIENLTGSAYADNLTGNASANALNGGTGNDTLTGGVGQDSLTGGSGNDRFDFNALSEMGTTSATWDGITDFTRGQDLIDLSTLDANTATTANDAFTTLIASSASFTAAGQLKLAGGILYGNVDADSTAEFGIALTGVSTLATTDFLL